MPDARGDKPWSTTGARGCTTGDAHVKTQLVDDGRRGDRFD
jgi:hypothetical protein